MTFVVIYDANVLYPSTLRDVLIRLAQTGLVQAKWTETTWMKLSGPCTPTDRTWTKPDCNAPGPS